MHARHPFFSISSLRGRVALCFGGLLALTNSAYAQTPVTSVPMDQSTISAAAVAAVPGVALATSGTSVTPQLYEASSAANWRIWQSGFASYARTGADSRSAGLSSYGAGISVGLERLFDPTLLTGVSISYGHTTSASLGTRSDADNASVAAYAVWNPIGGLELSGLLGGSHSEIDASHILIIGGIGTTAQGSTRGAGLNAAATLGYRLRFPTTAGEAYFKPFASLSYSSLHRMAYSELNSVGTALLLPGQTFERASGSVGITAGIDMPLGNGWIVRPELLLAWSRYLVDPALSVLALLSGVPLVLYEPEPGRDAAVIGLDFVAWNSAGTQIFAGYSGEFRSNSQAHLARGGVRLNW